MAHTPKEGNEEEKEGGEGLFYNGLWSSKEEVLRKATKESE